MSSIAVALALTVVLVGSSLFVGGGIADKVNTRGTSVATSISGAKVSSTGVVTAVTP
ncbi:MAG: hypothetical protein KGO83_01260 [Paenibacillaceae bacterium]|nr:hypothetical protein [Paenibacillaceae bacterium]